MIQWFWLSVFLVALVLIVFPDSFVKLVRKIRGSEKVERIRRVKKYAK